MNTKPIATRPADTRESVPDDLKAAYQVHTLVQMLTMRLVAPHHTMMPAPFPSFLH